MKEGEEESMPVDAKIVKELLRSVGVENYEPRVVNPFLELQYRRVVDVLTDAQVYSEDAGKSSIDHADVKLVVQSEVNFNFTQPPPSEARKKADIAKRNRIPAIYKQIRKMMKNNKSQLVAKTLNSAHKTEDVPK